MPGMLYRLNGILEWMIISTLVIFGITYSSPHLADEADQVRAYTRTIEFDYVSWMLNAAEVKVQQRAVGMPGYISQETSKIVVSDYLHVTQLIIQTEDALNKIYSDSSITDKQAASVHIRSELSTLDEKQIDLAPLAEAVLEGQVNRIAKDFGLTTLGQTIPAVLFHTTSVPDALIVSPLAHIEETANISITPGLAADQQSTLENRVERGLNVSALVVPIGGVGVYPTMIMRSTDLSWLTSTIAHEWTHNFLEFRPLGLLYDHTPEIRTMNETTADIVGAEIGAELIKRYYPNLRGANPPKFNLITFPQNHPNPGDVQRPIFDFRAEMHTTRVTVDALLAAGDIGAANGFMEQQRQIFLKNGYYLRKLNQAYFAFYGAYAEVPGGAAGEDPVGPAVRALRAESKSLAEFLNRISWMTSFDQLKKAVGQ